MKKILFSCFMSLTFSGVLAGVQTVKSPDGKLAVTVEDNDGRAFYSIVYDGKQMMERSALGLKTNIGDFSNGLSMKDFNEKRIDKTYSMRTTKTSYVHYVANQININYENSDRQKMTVTFNVSDNDVAFRYSFPQQGETATMVVNEEMTSFRLPQNTTTFICPQSDAMVGWKRTKPSYEEEYKPDAAMTEKSRYGEGYTFPCLFHVGNDGWVLVSETGNDGGYVGSHLSDYNVENGYQVTFPMQGEANGWGTSTAAMPLPGATPWRTVTVGNTLKPIVETTIPYDVVEEKYKASEQYGAGRYTWSWLIWQDKSINYNDQKAFIDLAGEMGYEYVLVDNFWDAQIGRDRITELSRYAKGKGVSLMLWYNSNGAENDAPQTPKNCMNTSVSRKREMAWLKSIGVKGIKVDFFAGDKQHTMQLYEDILSDANDFGLQVIFHGCTLPRGWEKMYPNFVSSEAVLASENVYFSDHHARQEGFELTMHPFCRNAVASMDWGGTIMNRRMSRDNNSRHQRYTSDIFEMAASIVNQSAIQCIAIQPNNLTELPQFEKDFLKTVPTQWDETRFIDGYPGKYVVIARRHGDDWYVAGLNGTNEELKLNISVPMSAGTSVDYYTDKKARTGKNADPEAYAIPDGMLSKLKIGKNGTAKVILQPKGGMILK
ncbi:glycoside hydrolase family 97 protein [Xylanibacter muris]|uniref:Glycoside hydrolase family 97 protein n=1 Tax=Xylanibacter muris TaxID=2736290 RepID=A0ABX2ALN2_9BACT|nr:glycoside hydrolase family 97 protein [Xylanibacter muris]NPD91105.1 glycoside hydrolase family 97 protein [Xylanibacter muris]